MIAQQFRLVLATLLAVFAAACVAPQHAQKVREAQDALSAAAAMETEAKFSPLGKSLGIDALADSPSSRYRRAERLIAEALAENRSDLKADSLYGTAMTVKAIAHWRLGESEKADEAAKAVVSLADASAGAATERAAGAPEPANQVFPRDEALCRALPTLMKIDALGRLTGEIDRQQADASQQFEDILRGVESCVVEFDALRKQPRMVNNPLLPYLAQCQCEAAYVVMQADSKVKKATVSDGQVDRLDKVCKDAMQRLEAQFGTTGDVYGYYKDLLQTEEEAE